MFKLRAIIIATLILGFSSITGIFPEPAVSPAIGAEKELVVATMWEYKPFSLKARRGRFFNESEILDTLVKMDHDMKLVPGLSTSWQRETPTRWTFTLRQGVTFHDGTDFNAESVRFSLLRVIDLLPYAQDMLDIASITAQSDHKLIIETRNPFGALPNQLTAGFTGIFAKSSFDDQGKFVHPVGTGPYRFVKYIKQDRTIVEAFDGYWGKSPAIRRVVYRYIPDHNTRVLSLESGEVDLAVNIPPPDVARLGNDPGFKVYSRPTAGLYYMTLNCQSGPFADPRIRRAVNMVIDRDALVNKALDGAGLPANEFFTPVFNWIPQNVDAYKKDTEKAGFLMKQAGYERKDKKWSLNGNPIELSLISYSSRTEMTALIEAVAGMLKQFGIDVDVKLYTWPGMLSLVKKGQYDGYIVFWTPELIAHPDLHLRGHMHSKRDYDYNKYQNPKVDRLLEQARGMDYGPEAKTVYRQVLNSINRDAPIAPLVHKVYVAASNNRLTGYRIHPSGFFFDFKSADLK